MDVFDIFGYNGDMDFPRIRKAIRYVIGTFFMFFIVLMAVVLVSGQGQFSVSLSPGDVISVDDGWYTKNADGSVTERNLPVRISADSDGIYRLYHTFYSVGYERYFCFYVHHQKIRVTLDGELLYAYEPEPTPSWIHTYRAFHHVVVIPQNMEGEMCVETEPLIKSAAGEYKSIVSGDSSGILFYILKARWYKLVVGLILSFVGIIFVLLSLMFGVYSKKDNLMRYLGSLMFVIGLWQMEESRALQLVFGSQSLHWCLEYVLPLFIPFFIFLFIYAIVGNRYRKTMLSLLTLDMGVTITQILLQITGTVQFTNTVFLSYALYIASFVVGLVLILKCMKFSSPALKGMFIGSMVAGLVLFVFNSFGIFSTPYTDALLLFGLLLIFVSLLLTVYQQTASRFEEIRMSEVYRRLAMVDISTGVGSRVAWYSFIDSFEDKPDRTEEACLIMFDMNNLKMINDTYGHMVGDRVIDSLCRCIEKAFSRGGKVYRVGGDEFICYCDKVPEKKVYQMLSAFDELVSEQALEEYPFTVAYGAAFFIPRTKKDFETAQTEADKRMYECKEAMKSGRS